MRNTYLRLWLVRESQSGLEQLINAITPKQALWIAGEGYEVVA
jgi:hypothetical protein